MHINSAYFSLKGLAFFRTQKLLIYLIAISSELAQAMSVMRLIGKR